MTKRACKLKKLDRLRSGQAPRVVDLFSGCGGLSLGFQRNGFEIAASVELDPLAAASHRLNFHGSLDGKKPEELARDITTVDPAQLIAEFAPKSKVEDVVDVVIGGPPCQAFARVGRAKLREVLDHPTAFKQDPRGNLYLRYVDYVRRLQPLAILMENVPDVINYGGHNIAEETCEVFAAMGYVCRYTLLNTAYYGVPQSRERMFLLAYAEELGADVVFPEPTHWFNLPRGYEGSRQVALKHVLNRGNVAQMPLLDDGSMFYLAPPLPSPKTEPAVTAREAVGDLPPITQHLTGELKRGARHLDEFIPYRHIEPSAFVKDMRSWKGFESDGGVYDHTIRSLSDRDFEIFRRMKPGDQYPEAHKIALQIFEERLGQLEERGTFPIRDSAEWKELMKRTVPPYDAAKFPNKWRKMSADEPARTLMAHLGKDGYSHIHYDSRQARTISVREAARLMSFPDGFRFVGTMNPAFRQIGNAVPPLMAAAIARRIMFSLTGALCKEDSLLSA